MDLGTREPDSDYLLKLILVGDSGVGKSALLKCYMGCDFSKQYVSTVGVDFEIKQVTINEKKVNLQIWDTAGQERFRTITTSYYRSADAVLLLFDVTDRTSFENANEWLENVRKYAKRDVDIILVGHKVDLERIRVVEFNQAKEFADEQYLQYIETSAKTRHNVDRAFSALAANALREKVKESTRKQEQNKAVTLTPPNRTPHAADGNAYGCC